MPETMVERVGRAIAAANSGEHTSNAQAQTMARAAIEAMRSPTDAMVKAGTIPTREIWLGNGTTATGLGLGADQGSIWRAMIDAALSEGAER